MHELMDSAWAMYQRCLHTFLGAVMLSFVPVAVAVFSGLTCHPQSTRSLGGGTWYGVCGVVGETSGLRITETQFVVIMVLATVFLITVVLGVPAVLLRVLVFDQVRSRFRDLYFWRRYGLAYTLFTDKRYVHTIVSVADGHCVLPSRVCACMLVFRLLLAVIS
jgi:hypothetical protein